MAIDGADNTAVQPATFGAQLQAISRLTYIDNLRILLTILVVLTHLSIGYGAVGDWYYNEKGEMSLVSSVLMAFLVIFNQSFFMGFFFLISSYLSPSSLEHKGNGRYLIDRLKRLGIPLLFYFFVINPFLNYVLQVYGGFHGSPWEFFSERYFRTIGVGPMWFVETLLIFAFFYVLWHFFRKPSSFGNTVSKIPNNGAIALFTLILGLVSFIVRIWLPVGWWLEPLHLQLAHFPQYISLLIAGVFAYRQNWFDAISDSQARVWKWVILALTLLFPVLFLEGGAAQGDVSVFVGGLHWQSLTYAIWEQFIGIAIIITLLVSFRKGLNHQGRLASAMSGASYSVYVFHPPIVVLLALALSSVRLDMALKFVLVAPLAVSLCFLFGYLIRKLPLARDIL